MDHKSQTKVPTYVGETAEHFSYKELIDINSMKTEALRLYTFHQITEHEYESLMKILEGNDKDSHEVARLLMKEFKMRAKRDRTEERYG